MKWLPDLLVRSELPPIHRYLVCVIAVHRGLDGRWWNPTQTQLAELTGLSQPCVSKALRQLQAAQWIIRSEVSSGGIETPCLRLHPSRTPPEVEKLPDTPAQVPLQTAPAQSRRRSRMNPADRLHGWEIPFEALPPNEQQDILDVVAAYERGETITGARRLDDLRWAFKYGKAVRRTGT